MSNEAELAPHVQEIARALEHRLEMEQIEDELRRYVEYGVPLLQAKRDIIRNHGGSLRAGKRKLDALVAGEGGVEMTAKVLTVNPKEVIVKGEPKQIFFGYLADETARVTYTAWKDFKLERGATYDIGNAYVKPGFREGVAINLGDYTTIQRSASDLPNVVEAGGATLAQDAGRLSPERSLKELRDGMNSVTVTGRVLAAREKTLQGPQGDRVLIEGELGDATAKIPFTSWAPQAHGPSLQPDAVVRIRNAYVKAFRGVPNLNFGESARVEVLGAGEVPAAKELAQDTPFTIGELERAGGAVGVVVEGTVLDVKKGSGLILRCAKDGCNRVLQKRECRIHGKTDGAPDLRVKAVLDDGTGASTFFLGREGTERFLGKTLAECQREAMEAMTTDVIEDRLRELLTLRRLRVHGTATSDSFGLSIIAMRAEFPEPRDLKAEAEALLAEALEHLPEAA